MASLFRLKLLQRHLPLILTSRLENCLAELHLKSYATSGSDIPVSGTNWTGPRKQRSQVVSPTRLFGDGPQKSKGMPKKLLQRFNDENKYIHNHVHRKLANLSELGSMINTLSVKSLIDELDQFTKVEHPDEQIYKSARSNFFKAYKSSVRNMSLRELAIFMTFIKNFEKSEFRVVKRMVDVELNSRLRNINRKITTSDLDLYLHLADVFYQCNAITTFVIELVARCAESDHISLNDSQLMYMLFLVILEREDQGLLARYEERISKLLDEPTFEDLSTICLSYFKTESIIENLSTQKKIFDRTLKLLPMIDYTQPGYCAIIKTVRYSRNLSMRESVIQLISKVTQDPKCANVLDSMYNLTQTAKLIETYRIYNLDLLDRLRETIFRCTEEFRIKDIQYALSTLSNFGWRDLKLGDSMRRDLDKLCHSIVTESRPDAKYQHAHLLPLLRSFLIFGYFNDEFIRYTSKTLEDDEKVDKLQGIVLDFEKTFLLAYAVTRIESDGEKLQGSENLLAKMSAAIKRAGSTGSVRRDSSIHHLNFLLHPDIHAEVYNFSAKTRSIAKILLTEEGLNSPELHYNFQFTMAHQNYADLVISVNRQAPGSFHSLTMMPRQVVPNQKHCLVYAVRNSDFMDGRDRLSGFKVLIMRLLIRLGYHVVVVNLDQPDIVQLSSQIRSVLQAQDNESRCDEVSS